MRRGWVGLAILLLVGLVSASGRAESPETPPKARSGQSGVRFSLPQVAWKETDFKLLGPLLLEAETLTWSEEGKVLEARGNVQATLGARVLRCDFLKIRLDREEVHAEGNGSLEGEGEKATFESADLSIPGATLVLAKVGAERLARRYSVRAGRASRLGDGRIFLNEAWFTPCACPSGAPSWAIQAKSVRINKEGRATLRGGWLLVKEKKVLPIPLASFSLGDGRASGFLLPDLRFGGSTPFQVGLPLFLVTSRTTDLTLTPTWIDTRGLKGAGEFRFLYQEDQGGSLRLEYIHDSHLRDELREAYPGQTINDLEPLGYDENRFWLSLRNRAFPGPFSLGSDLDLTRDDRWFKDFRADVEGRSQSYLPSHLWATVTQGLGSAGVDAVLVRDLTEPTNAYTLQRLPGVWGEGVGLRPKTKGWDRLSVNLHTGYQAFLSQPDLWHPQRTWDAPFADVGRDGVGQGREGYPGKPDADGSQGDGRYQQGEPVHRLHRVEGEAEARFSMDPFQILHITPQVGMRGVLYGGFWERSEVGYLLVPQAKVDLRTLLYRDLPASGSGRSSHRHLVEPWVSFRWTPWVGEAVHPLITLGDVATREARLSFGLTQRLLERKRGLMGGEGGETASVLELRLWAEWEGMREARMEYSQPWRPIRMDLLWTRERGQAAVRLAVDPHGPFLTWLSADVSTRGASGNYLRAGFDWYAAQDAGAGLLWVDGEASETLRRLPSERNEVAQFSVQGTLAPWFLLGTPDKDPKGILGGIRVSARLRVSFADFPGSSSEGVKRILSQVYSLDYVSPCQCFSAGLDFTVDTDQPLPSLGLRLQLGAE